MTGNSSGQKGAETRHDPLSQLITLGSLVAFGGFMGFCTMKFYTRFLKRIPNGNHVTPAMFDKGRWIKGIVTS
jgi:hypothetical protein